MGNIVKDKRLKISEFVNSLINYDIISFDIFDTLILRNVSDPKDVFAFIAPKYSLIDFGKIRVNTEARLRAKKAEEFGNREVNIYEIYEEIYKYTSIDPQIGIKNELEEEMNFCYANPYMKMVYDTLIQNNKKIIITSDMYLPQNLMKKLLKKCGYEGYDKLFVSCDYHKSKSNLELYKYINDTYVKNHRIIHIGDNYTSDYKNAKEIGWDAFHYPQNKELGRVLDKIGISFGIGSYYSSIVNNFLCNGKNDRAPYNNQFYRYGFTYGGLFILGYVNWIHKIAKENNNDKIVFLSRDGHILKKVYDQMFSDIPSVYALWSRHASMKTSLKTNLEAYMWQFITRRKKDNPKLTVETILNDMEFGMLIKKLKKIGVDKDDKIGKKDVEKKLMNLILENADEVKKVGFKYSKTAKEYYREIIGESQNISIVDIGWRGSGALSLKYLFENEWGFNCKVKALVSGTYKMYNNRDFGFQINKDIESYMFCPSNNLDLLLSHQTNLTVKNTIVELFTTACHPSFLNTCRDSNEYGFVFDIPETENYEKNELIFRGELDFIKEYLKHMNGHLELLNISGRDAYMCLNDMMYGEKLIKFKKVFKDMVFNILIGGLKNQATDSMETFKELCEGKKKGV